MNSGLVSHRFPGPQTLCGRLTLDTMVGGHHASSEQAGMSLNTTSSVRLLCGDISDCTKSQRGVKTLPGYISPSPWMLSFHCHLCLGFLPDRFHHNDFKHFRRGDFAVFLCDIFCKKFWRYFAGVLLRMIEENCLFQWPFSVLSILSLLISISSFEEFSKGLCWYFNFCGINTLMLEILRLKVDWHGTALWIFLFTKMWGLTHHQL